MKRNYEGNFYPIAKKTIKPTLNKQPTYYAPVNSTRSLLAIEKKYQDGILATTVLSPTWTGGEVDPTTLLGFNSIALGDGESERDGRQCKVTSIQITGQILTAAIEAAGAPLDGTFVRLMLVLDTQTNGAQLNAEDVMVTGSGYDANSYRNLKYVKRFQVLKEKSFTINRNNQMNEGAVDSFASPVNYTNFKMNYKFKKDGGLLVNYSNTGAVIANVTDNSVHLIACYGGVGTAPYIHYSYRTRFVG